MWWQVCIIICMWLNEGCEKHCYTFVQVEWINGSGSPVVHAVHDELSKHLMHLTNSFCREQLWQQIPKVRYIKKAAVCLGKQMGVEWLNSINGLCGTTRLRVYLAWEKTPKCCPSKWCCSCPTETNCSTGPIDNTLVCLKQAFDNNFVASLIWC